MTRTIALLLCLTATPTVAEITKIDLAMNESTSNPQIEGVSATFLTGAFDSGGLYAAEARMDAESVFPPHVHTDLRMTVVTSGTMYLGEGETFDEAALIACPEGSLALTAAGPWLFMAAGEEGFTVLEIGAGPSETEFQTE